MKILNYNCDGYVSSDYNSELADLMSKHKIKMDYGSYWYEIIAISKDEPDAWQLMIDELKEAMFDDIDYDEYDIDTSSPFTLMETYQELLDNDEYIYELKEYKNDCKQYSTLNTPFGLLLYASQLKYCGIYTDDIMDKIRESDVGKDDIMNVYRVGDYFTKSKKYGIELSSEMTLVDIDNKKRVINDWKTYVRHELLSPKEPLISMELCNELIDTIVNRVIEYLDNYDDVMKPYDTWGELFMPDANEKIYNVVVVKWGGGHNHLCFETPNYYYYFNHESD